MKQGKARYAFGHRHWAGWLVIWGALGFLSVVTALHLVQPGYDARYQLMSELALGPYGWAMLPAFCLLAMSVLGVQLELRRWVSSIFLQLLYSGVVLSLVGAGVFPLGSATELHVVLVTIAFVLLGVGMYLVPSYLLGFFMGRIRATSWLLGGFMVVIVAFSGTLIPPGIAQRLAASCILIWLAWTGWILSGSSAIKLGLQDEK